MRIWIWFELGVSILVVSVSNASPLVLPVLSRVIMALCLTVSEVFVSIGWLLWCWAVLRHLRVGLAGTGLCGAYLWCCVGVVVMVMDHSLCFVGPIVLFRFANTVVSFLLWK